jgi:hypothetical protein
MAECTLYSSLSVSTGGGSDDAAGIYLPAGIYEGYTLYTRTGDVNSLPRIRVEGNRWVIRSTTDVYGDLDTHATTTYPAGQVPICPVGLVFDPLPTPWGDGTVAAVTGVLIPVPEIPQNTFGLAADVVALISKNHGSVENYLRLRNQGQV